MNAPMPCKAVSTRCVLAHVCIKKRGRCVRRSVLRRDVKLFTVAICAAEKNPFAFLQCIGNKDVEGRRERDDIVEAVDGQCTEYTCTTDRCVLIEMFSYRFLCSHVEANDQLEPAVDGHLCSGA